MSTEQGLLAEAQAADFLRQEGFKILGQNWRSRWSEIDIVASKAGVIHFVEVKYRSRESYGSGFEYITPDKQNRLRRAAAAWITQNGGADYQIDVIAISGFAKPQKLEYLPNAVSG